MSPRKAAQEYARIVARSGTAELEQLLRFAVGNRVRWIAKLLRAIDERFDGKRPSVHTLTEFILRHQSFRPVVVPREEAPLEPSAKMRPAEGRPREWNVPAITTIGDLAQWLNLRPNELFWFADPRGLEHDGATKLCHYKRVWRRKGDGTFRLIESPKQRLKAIQRALLHHVLEKIPVHESCHGFVRGRSILTCAAPHSGKTLVLKMDIKDFFPTFTFARVQNIFLTAGYPESVAQLLTGLCTTICPRAELHNVPLNQQSSGRALYGRKHLPQGAPTSPMIANLAAFNLDCRLAGLAKSAGATYTRYADDLIFSGDESFARGANRFLVHAMSVALEEGFIVHARKTRVMRQGVAQRAVGLTLNERPNIRRDDFDALKATLNNCLKRGLASQNRSSHPNWQAHLEGRVSHVSMVNAKRGEKLRRILAAIDWSK